MSNYMHQELLFFCRTFLAGVCLAACYDVLRIFRKVMAHNPFFVGIEDIFYWCCAGFFLFSVIYGENDGIIRSYALLSIGLGAFVYHVGPSGLLVKYSSLALKKLVFFLEIAARPVRKCRKRLKFPWDRVKISLYEQKSIQKIRKRINENNKNREKQKQKKKSKKSKCSE